MYIHTTQGTSYSLYHPLLACLDQYLTTANFRDSYFLYQFPPGLLHQDVNQMF